MICLMAIIMIIFTNAVGADADEDRIELLLSEVKGKDITELIASGREKLASVPSGVGGGVAVAATGGSGAAPAAAAAAELKKEEKVVEKEESDDVCSFISIDLHCLFLNCFFYGCMIWDSVCLTEDGMKHVLLWFLDMIFW
uniref:Uncharacterized protein n=1 Tax=Lactuca sativa TaxID=4236 RepID=A0A9R1VRD5_LACSA|nr:hypothetical protein LSAT_V11C400201380 [Lactuca sativa]